MEFSLEELRLLKALVNNYGDMRNWDNDEMLESIGNLLKKIEKKIAAFL